MQISTSQEFVRRALDLGGKVLQRLPARGVIGTLEFRILGGQLQKQALLNQHHPRILRVRTSPAGLLTASGTSHTAPW